MTDALKVWRRSSLAGIGESIWDHVEIQPLSPSHHGTAKVRFTVGGGHFFWFWHSMSTPNPESGSDLYVVPSYHPVMQGPKDTWLINGSTNAVVCGKALRSVFAPPASLRAERSIFDSWSYLKHPVYAYGASFEVEVNVATARTDEGEAEIQSLVAAALGIGRYVAISGGFSTSLTYPQNLIQKGLVAGVERARGSEAHCVWTYRTLQQEGNLAGSYVPAWFLREGWLEAYEAAPLPKELP